MGKIYASIDQSVQAWMSQQQMFFVATAPLSERGHVNLSPKGHDTLRVVDEKTLAYADIGGSGVETIAHVRENGRVVIMMCAFTGPPKIFRFYGQGSVVTPNQDGFAELLAMFDVSELGIRAIIRIDVERIQDSCGYGVPNYDFKSDRRSSQNWLENKTIEDMHDYQLKKNLTSLDDLPGISEEEARAYIFTDDNG